MSAKYGSFITGLEVPEPNELVVARGGEGFAVRRKGERPRFLRGMSPEDDGIADRAPVPETDFAV